MRTVQPHSADARKRCPSSHDAFRLWASSPWASTFREYWMEAHYSRALTARAWCSATPLDQGVSEHIGLQDQALWCPAGLQSPLALACTPLRTAAAALWTFTFPLIKLKTRHITKMRASKISGGKHYWEQKPGGLFFRGWLLFQSVLTSIFFPALESLGTGDPKKRGALTPVGKEPRQRTKEGTENEDISCIFLRNTILFLFDSMCYRR